MRRVETKNEETPLNDAPPNGQARQKNFSRIGAIAVVFALACALSSFLILSGFSPLAVTDRVATTLVLLNVAALLILLALVIAEGWLLIAARRAGAAASGLHLRIVRVFALLAAMPAAMIAVIGTLTLDRAMDPAFMQDVRGFIFSTADAARLFGQSQCRALLQEANLTAADLDRAKSMYDADRVLFQDFFASRARFLGFTSAALINEAGDILVKAEFEWEGKPRTSIGKPEKSDFEDARAGEPTCIVRDDGDSFAVVRHVAAFPNAYLYVARPVDPFTREFPQRAENLIAVYNGFESHRRAIIFAFAAMFGLLSLIMLLAAMFLGLNFANKLVAPIRRLIAAADEVSAGNLYVRVSIDSRDGDLAHLGATFNKMTAELRQQHNSLLAANQLIDQRRAFTEAVLSGVPAAVLGVDGRGIVNVLNPSAELLSLLAKDEAIGRPLVEVIPEIAPKLAEAAISDRPAQLQLSLLRSGRERIVNTRVSLGARDKTGRSFVVTLDDITDLITAQRTSAWADVARRIAHEIKNPLTPIQLSAERLKRKYGKVIVKDLDIFNQCTDTIVRQVDDIKRMVDEFSSFARMPKAQPHQDDLAACLKQVVFLQRVGHPEIDIAEEYQPDVLNILFDRRLMSQAFTNVIKNSAEGVGAAEGAHGPGRILIRMSVAQDFVFIDVIDNGRGFPAENRQRLLEPYVTTRAEGTGLGLPIVAKIMEEHGGGIELLDAPDGKGAHVRLYFRAQYAAGHVAGDALAADAAPAQPAQPVNPGSSKAPGAQTNQDSAQHPKE